MMIFWLIIVFTCNYSHYTQFACFDSCSSIFNNQIFSQPCCSIAVTKLLNFSVFHTFRGLIHYKSQLNLFFPTDTHCQINTSPMKHILYFRKWLINASSNSPPHGNSKIQCTCNNDLLTKHLLFTDNTYRKRLNSPQAKL